MYSPELNPALVHIQLLDRKLIMEKGFLDKVEDNAAVRTWSETTQCEKGDSLVDGYVSELWDFTRISSLKDLILAHPDVRKRVDVFALSIYGLVVFPKALGNVDEAITDLFDRLDKRVTPVPVIFTETFRVSYRVFSKNYSPLKEVVATPRRDDILDEKWMVILQNLQEEDIEWRAPWLLLDEILYRCGDFDWVSMLGIWGSVGYTPLLVLRQYRSRQFIPVTHC
ncbi:hypothetical protein Gotur_026876 [Gossypium turneri]